MTVIKSIKKHQTNIPEELTDDELAYVFGGIDNEDYQRGEYITTSINRNLDNSYDYCEVITGVITSDYFEVTCYTHGILTNEISKLSSEIVSRLFIIGHASAPTWANQIND